MRNILHKSPEDCTVLQALTRASVPFASFQPFLYDLSKVRDHSPARFQVTFAGAGPASFWHSLCLCALVCE